MGMCLKHTSPRENLRQNDTYRQGYTVADDPSYQSSPSMEPQPGFCYDDLVQS
jgi:hypothetical protein